MCLPGVWTNKGETDLYGLKKTIFQTDEWMGNTKKNEQKDQKYLAVG